MRTAAASLVLLGFGLGLAGCLVTIDDDGECSAGSNCTYCPLDPPANGASCVHEGASCAYGGTPECPIEYVCEAVYPEADAPTRWTLQPSDDCGQCTALPTCDPSEIQVDSCDGVTEGYDCHSVSLCGSTIYCEIPICDGPPACEIYETEVSSCDGLPVDYDCHSITNACGDTTYCLIEVCDGPYPVCDDGDMEVADCPLDASCYTLEAPCGDFVTCLDAELPQHNCPVAPPPEGSACDETLQPYCDYPTEPGCYDEYQCAGGTFSYFGSACAGGG